MKGYVLSVAGVVLLSAVISLILPGGKMGKFIRGAMKLFVLVVLVSPFVTTFGGGELNWEYTAVGEDTAYLSACAARLEEEDEARISAYIMEEFSLFTQVKAERSAKANFPRRKITVKILDFGIFGEDEHIDIMTRVQSSLVREYGCEAEVYEDGGAEKAMAE